MKLEIKQEQRTVFSWDCPFCMKKMLSLFKKQVQYNAKRHLESHGEA